jgi:hypothetical protein
MVRPATSSCFAAASSSPRTWLRPIANDQGPGVGKGGGQGPWAVDQLGIVENTEGGAEILARGFIHEPADDNLRHALEVVVE